MGILLRRRCRQGLFVFFSTYSEFSLCKIEKTFCLLRFYGIVQPLESACLKTEIAACMFGSIYVRSQITRLQYGPTRKP